MEFKADSAVTNRGFVSLDALSPVLRGPNPCGEIRDPTIIQQFWNDSAAV